MSGTIEYCKPSDKKQSICSPSDNDVWYKSSYNLLTWEIANPIYQSEYSLNIFFYYYKNYHYYQTISFKMLMLMMDTRLFILMIVFFRILMKQI